MSSDPTQEDHDTLLQGLNLLATIPSIIGSFLMSYFCLKSVSTNTSIKLLLALGLSDFFYSVNNLTSIFGPTQGSGLCNLQALFRSSFALLSVWIASSIAVLHYKLIRGDPNFRRTRFIVLAILSGICVSFGLCLWYLSISAIIYINILFSPVYASNQFAFTQKGPMCHIDVLHSDDFVLRTTFKVIYQGIFITGGAIVTLLSYILTIKRVQKIHRILYGQRRCEDK